MQSLTHQSIKLSHRLGSPAYPFLWSTFHDVQENHTPLQKKKNKKTLHDPDNNNGAITHLEPDILECEVKWTLGSITISKASGNDEIPVKLFQILKDDAVKMLHSICQQIWRT